MKVLSLKEPFATLIKGKKKFIETRSWKTNYRGELYIHASITKISKELLSENELMDLLENESLNYGYIICKCNLVDCIYMTEEYVENIKLNNYQEYICGKYKEGRYAWVLDNIIPLETPIKAKGQLGLWSYYNEFEIMEFMKNIEYGWLDIYDNKHYQVTEDFASDYKLQSPKEILKSNIGVCWDQVELERYYFHSNDLNVKTFFIVHYDNDKCPTHTFLAFKKENSYYWFEHSWSRFEGIHQYDSLKDLLIDVRSKFIKFELNSNYKAEKLILREYSKPKSGLNVKEFYEHCEKGLVIDIDK